MTERTREVIIDDRDDRIQFTDNWTAGSGDAYNNRGRHGPVYRNTLRGSNVDGAKLSFTFSGTKADVFGTTDPEFEAGSTEPDPNWECVLDGIVSAAGKGGSSKSTESSINRWPFCSFPDLIPGQHTIELVVRSKGRTFWFDSIQYVPTDAVSGETIEAAQNDQDLSYSSGWESFRAMAFITRTRGSTVTFPFSGTGITLLGNYHSSFSNTPSTSTYTIDSGSPVSFTIRGGVGSDDYNRRLFEVSGLSAGTHTLVVTYQGAEGSESMPLMVDRFFIEGGTNLRVSGGGSGGVTQTNPDSPSSLGTSTSSGPIKTGTIPDPNSLTTKTPIVAVAVGVTLGGVTIITILLLFLFWHRKQRHIRLNSRDDLEMLFNHAHHRPPIPQAYTPVPPHLGTALLHAAPPHPEALYAHVHAPHNRANAPPPHPELEVQTHTHVHAPPRTNATPPHPELEVRTHTHVHALPDSGNATSFGQAPGSELPGPPLNHDHQALGSIPTSRANTILRHQLENGLRLPDAQQMRTVEVPPIHSVQYQDGLGDVR